MDLRPKTIICDIDGTLVEHCPPNAAANPKTKLELLPGAMVKLLEWEHKGYRIILLTGRKESMRNVTIQQLNEAGIFYDQLIMGVGGGTRHLINDIKPNNRETAFAYNVPRNIGVKDLEL